MTESNDCPFLGMPGDATTHYQYPSRHNYCHIPHQPEPVLTTHQQTFCLTSAHVHCPVYRRENLTVLPPDIRQKTDEVNGSSNRKRVGGWVGIVGVGVFVIVVIFFIFPLPNFNPVSNLLQQTNQANHFSLPTLHAETTQTPIPVPTSTVLLDTPTRIPPSQTLAPLPTQTALAPTLTPTYFPTPGPGLGTPFGTMPQFVIHVVQIGQSFTGIASLYGTTSEVLAAINSLKEGQTLWAGRPIVVPLGIVDPAGLPQFTVYLNPENTTLNELAVQLNADPEQIRRYNALGPQPEIPAGRWLIIPGVADS